MLPRNRKRPFAKASRLGSAAVECALVSPVLVILVLGALDVGQFVNVAQTVDNASREGARLASRDTDATVTQIKTHVLDYLGNSFPAMTTEQLKAATNINISNGASEVTAIDDMSVFVSGDPVSVRVTFRFDSVRWINGFPSLDGETLSTTTVMRRE